MDCDDYVPPLSTPEEIRAALDAWKEPPPETPPGGWTADNVGPELGRLLRASRPIVLPLPPERDATGAVIIRVAGYGQFLATRARARDIIRDRLEALPPGEAVVLDWTRVEAVTGAFASELAAWLLSSGRKFGSDGMNDEVRETWETAARRLAEVPVPESSARGG